MAHEGTAVNIEKYGIVNTAINTIVNALQGESWVRLLSRLVLFPFSVSCELIGPTELARMCFFTSLQKRRSLPLSRTGASVKLRGNIYTISLKFHKVLLHPPALQLSGRQVEWRRGSHGPPSRGSWMAAEPSRRSMYPPPVTPFHSLTTLQEKSCQCYSIACLAILCSSQYNSPYFRNLSLFAKKTCVCSSTSAYTSQSSQCRHPKSDKSFRSEAQDGSRETCGPRSPVSAGRRETLR